MCDDADEAKKGRLRRRSGEGIDLGASLYRYPAGTHPDTLGQYKVLRSVYMDQVSLLIKITDFKMFRM